MNPEGALSGDSIGPYLLQREIGRGGVGMVYLARRSDGEYEKTVALKLIKRGLDSDEIVERFRHERQTLATLEHPNIARLLEGGRTEKGLPFFVMDFVEGDPIDAYCDNLQLSITARLRLFQKVCAAVQYAHQNSIVHRDLKPSNILVTKGGEPKLLDFGIAKVLSQEASPTQTQAGVRLMTLEYASPEQVRVAAITTLSDVYSLGVLLYRLLTGHSPYLSSETGTGALEKAILEQETKKPSEAIHSVEHIRDDDGQIIHSVTPETVSAARAGTPDKLRHRLAGDVDSIVLKALRKEPKERYSSVEQFSNDIERHLSSQPVLARKGMWSYRASRFVRRHKFVVAAASVFLATIIGFSISTQIQSQRIRQERDKAEQVSKFLVDLFEVSEPGKSRGETVTAREILDRGAENIAVELSGQPGVQASMMNVIGNVYNGLALFQESQRILEASLNLQQKLHGSEHREVAKALNDLAVVYYALGKYDNADSLFKQALSIRERVLGNEHAEVAETLNKYAMLIGETGDIPKAITLSERALEMRKRLLGEDHLEVARNMNDLAQLWYKRHDYVAARELLRTAAELLKKRLGEWHPEIAAVLNDLSVVYQATGEFDQAFETGHQALDMHVRIFGKDHFTVAQNLNNVALIHSKRGEYQAAIELYSKGTEMFRSILGNDHPRLADYYHNLAVIQSKALHYDKAESLYTEALRIRRISLSDTINNNHPQYYRLLNNFASELYHRNKLAEAEKYYREALTIRNKVLPLGRPYVASSLVGLAHVLYARANYSEAEALLREGLQTWQAVGGNLLERRIGIADGEAGLGACMTENMKYAEAESLLVKSYPVLKEGRGAEHVRTQKALQWLIKLYQAWGKPEKAAEYRALLPSSEETQRLSAK